MSRWILILGSMLPVLVVPSLQASERVESPPHPRVASEWLFLGLRGHEVGKLKLVDDVLYACTDDGLYRKNLASTDTLWAALGLAGRRVRTLWSASPETLLAATAVLPGDSVSIHRTTDGGSTWATYQNGFGSDRNPEPADLEGTGRPRGVLAVAAGIEKSTDGGTSWRRVADQCVFNFVRRNPVAPGHFWAGGETCIFSPFIMSSSDSGKTWRFIQLEAGGDNASDAVAFHPVDPRVIYTGMEGRIQRTLDGGDHWEEVTTPNPAMYFYGIAVRRKLPLRIYAAGATRSSDPVAVVLYSSDDGGQTWTTHTDPGPLRTGVLDLLYADPDGEDWLFVATDRGVYRWIDATSPVASRSWSQVKRLYGASAGPRNDPQ